MATDREGIKQVTQQAYTLAPAECESTTNSNEDPALAQDQSRMLFWLMCSTGPGDWKWVPAEAPCWKGEVRLNFRLFNVVVGWQRQKEGRDGD